MRLTIRRAWIVAAMAVLGGMLLYVRDAARLGYPRPWEHLSRAVILLIFTHLRLIYSPTPRCPMAATLRSMTYRPWIQTP